MLVACVIWLGRKCDGFVGRSLVTIGDASYSIYLFQVLALPAIAVAMRVAHIPEILPIDPAVIVLWIASCAAGVVFWRVVERPITELLKSTVSSRQTSDAVEATGNLMRSLGRRSELVVQSCRRLAGLR